MRLPQHKTSPSLQRRLPAIQFHHDFVTIATQDTYPQASYLSVQFANSKQPCLLCMYTHLYTTGVPLHETSVALMPQLQSTSTSNKIFQQAVQHSLDFSLMKVGNTEPTQQGSMDRMPVNFTSVPGHIFNTNQEPYECVYLHSGCQKPHLTILMPTHWA